jgi:ribosomal protein L13
MPNYAKNNTTRATKTGFNRPYFLLDASKTPIGRIASEAAKILMGKNRADFSPDVDMGGMVIIINADDQVLTGKKAEKKVYFRYGRRLGSLKSRGYEEQKKLDFKFPIYTAIKRMLPKNRHQDLRINNRLFIVRDENHGITAPISIIDLVNKVVINPTNLPKKVSINATLKQNSEKVDDLTIIEGIGPKIKQLFHDANITTFAQLSHTSIEKMKEVLTSGGTSFASHNPQTWAEQAKLASEGKMEELKTWQDKLNGGQEVK